MESKKSYSIINKKLNLKVKTLCKRGKPLKQQKEMKDFENLGRMGEIKLLGVEWV